MVIEITKNTSASEVKKILPGTRRKKKCKAKSVAAFFGKLPTIEDGLSHQKSIRNEWK
jgi:hypothetical protein